VNKLFHASLAVILLLSGCATHQPYSGVNPENPQFERGISVPPLDLFGDLLSKIPQLLFWDLRYGNHRVSAETEQALSEFLKHYDVKDVKVRINQWAPHKEIGRLVTNPHIAWPYKIIFFPSTLITSILGRPFGGLLISDYYDPGSNTVHIFSDHPAIALHEGGHALDFSRKDLKGTYAIARVLPGMNLFQESVASEEAMLYFENSKRYEELLDAYKILYPAYATYVVSYISASTPAYIGALIIGHWMGRFKAREKEWQLQFEGKMLKG
jgi:hypothetical protein